MCFILRMVFLKQQYQLRNISNRCVRGIKLDYNVHTVFIVPKTVVYLRKQQSPVLLPIAVLVQAVWFIINNPLFVVYSALVLVFKNLIYFTQSLKEQFRSLDSPSLQMGFQSVQKLKHHNTERNEQLR